MSLDAISLGILWDRLISITDEIINVLVRTSFSNIVRESYDLSCVVFDRRGRSLAQGTYGSPGFIGTAPLTLAHMLRRFEPHTLEPGDVVITNDPWQGTGHLFDVSVMRPVFRRGELVGYVMSITHLPDIGGAGFSATAGEVFIEGLRLPICKLVHAGRMNELLLEVVRVNTRVPEQTIGDLIANVTCTAQGERMLIEFLDEYGLKDLESLSDTILSFSERAMRDELRAIPDGTYRNAMRVEGFDGPIDLACAVTVRGDEVAIDFEGTGPTVASAINVPFCYSRAFAIYAIKTLTTTKIPNNEGAIRPVTVTAPPGCILDARSPSATGGRHIVGHFVVPLIFGALAPALPVRIQADSGMLDLINVQGRDRAGEPVSSVFFAAGGFGALRGIDGASCCPGPSNITGTPIEVWETVTGLFVARKEFIVDSGGPGRYRGGLGQCIEMRNDTGHPMTMSILSACTEFAPSGVLEGRPGQLRRVLVNGRPVHSMSRYVLQPGDTLTTFEAGGGGYGPPAQRSPEAIASDIVAGFVSLEGARREYGFVPSSGQSVPSLAKSLTPHPTFPSKP